jgi:hypothetical protein
MYSPEFAGPASRNQLQANRNYHCHRVLPHQISLKEFEEKYVIEVDIEPLLANNV